MQQYINAQINNEQMKSCVLSYSIVPLSFRVL